MWSERQGWRCDVLRLETHGAKLSSPSWFIYYLFIFVTRSESISDSVGPISVPRMCVRNTCAEGSRRFPEKLGRDTDRLFGF